MNLIDLHVHSTASDGTKTPGEVVLEAKKVGLSAFALTDHDTCAGLKEAKELSLREGIEFVPGIELSCTAMKDKEIHMLGLFVDSDNAYFAEFLETLNISRNERNDRMAALLRDAGFNITMDEMYERFGNIIITRAHFARMLMEKGYVSEINKAFEKYLGDGCPCYVKRNYISPREAIDMIHSAGGLAILAHPMSYKLDRTQIRTLITGLTGTGLDGVEALYSTHTESDERFLRLLAKDLGIGYSGGSDYHGDNKPHIKLGVGRGGLRIGYHILEQLKERL